PGAGIRGIFFPPKSKRRRLGRSRRGKFHRNARQDRVENLSRKKEARSPAGSCAARNLSTALHHGHFHAPPIRQSGAASAGTGPHCLCRYPRTDAVNLVVVDLAVSIISKTPLDSLGK